MFHRPNLIPSFSFLAIIVFTLGPILVHRSYAHDLWFESSKGQLTFLYGHKISQHGGPQRLEYKPSDIQKIYCVDAKGDITTPQFESRYPITITVTSECASAAKANLSSGFWSKTPYGTQNLPKKEVQYPLKSWLSLESVLQIEQWTPRLLGSLSGGLEILPISNPLVAKIGEKLSFKITLDGNPIKGAVISYDGKPRGESNSEGLVNVKIRHGGTQHLQATLTTPLSGVEKEKADERIQTATLLFTIKEEAKK